MRDESRTCGCTWPAATTTARRRTYAAEHTFAHLAIPAELAGNIEFSYYEAGHMMYLHEPSRLAQSAQLAAFVRGGEEAR